MIPNLLETCWFAGRNRESVVLRCQHDSDGSWRWYEGPLPTELSAERPIDALDLAVKAWGGKDGFGASWW